MSPISNDDIKEPDTPIIPFLVMPNDVKDSSKSDEKSILIVQGLLAHFVFGTGLFIGFSIIF